MSNKHVNAVVVGAGAGGGVVAKELSAAGLSVVLFERGGWASYDAHDHDELLSQRTTVLGNAFGPDDDRYRRVVVNDDGTTEVVVPSDGAYNNVAACVGSGTVSYGAMAWRFMTEDFKMKTTYGHVEGATLEDWPITYDDLEPCYEKAEWEIGVAGDASQNPFAARRSKPYPMPPFAYNKEARMIEAAMHRAGLHPFPIPMLRNSVEYNSRPACVRRRSCCGFGCPLNAKSGTHNTVIPTAIATGNCELRTNCVVSELIIDDAGKISGVVYFDGENLKQEQTADIIVIAASATETPRLLLNSRSKHFPTGVGNRYDWVGRNLQGHAYTGAFGLFEEDIFDDVGPGASIAVSDFSHHNPGIVGGGILANEFTRLPYLFTGIRPPGSPSWGKAHKEFQRKYFRRNAQVVGPIQEMPNFDSRVQVDPSVKDAWGIPVVRLSGRRHPKDVEGCEFLSRKAEMILKEAGAFQTWRAVGGHGLSGGQHQAGTCRMGNDPQTSVTDKFGRVHDTPNVFIADASLHVNNGGFNPALTIMALGYWVGGHIAGEWQKGNRFS
ncbi:MAG TPA: GMC family oxidoreductase [Bacteroidota bacterium]|nr:GMC family oxidoreductase [Bacteroidota bacterium]